MPPTTLEGIERYLGSGLIKGIGPVFARKLVAAFGAAVFDVIAQSPERLREVEGVGPLRAERIRAGWADQRAIREIMLFLQSHAVGTSRAVRIYKTYGVDAIRLVTENPYRLARDIRGIGFKTADQIAARLGIEKTSMLRARAGLSYALLQAVDEGHCGLPEEELLTRSESLLEIPRAILVDALALEVGERELRADTIGDDRCVFLAHLWQAERTIAARLSALAAGRPPWPQIDADKAIPWVEARLRVHLAEGQRAAIRIALRSKLLVITGGPGVGKTTLVRSLLAILLAKHVRPELAAPTGRAAKRLAESAGLTAKTIHRLLEFDPKQGGFRRGAELPLEGQLLVLDEASMVDVPLMASLLKAVSESAAVVLVGDVDQLPPVGPGQVLRDLIDSGALPVARLTEVFRQAAESRIIQSAHRINAGRLPDLARSGGLSDFYFVDEATPESAVARVVDLVRQRIPERFSLDPCRDIQVLCPMNRGSAGARALNVALQAALNPPRREAPEVQRFGSTYRVGDKVMQVENDYDKEVWNGDIGFVRAVDEDAQEVVVECDGRVVVYQFGELDELIPAWAISVHKSQGSEYPAVVIPLDAGTEPPLHGGDAGEEARRPRRPAQGAGDRRQEREESPPLVQVAGMAPAPQRPQHFLNLLPLPHGVQSFHVGRSSREPVGVT
jgi:exodeoxyribonuclease V alpha subunit